MLNDSRNDVDFYAFVLVMPETTLLQTKAINGGFSMGSAESDSNSGVNDVLGWASQHGIASTRPSPAIAQPFLHLLHERDRAVMTSHLRGKPLREIACDLGISSGRASQIYLRAARIICSAQASRVRLSSAAVVSSTSEEEE
jgi:hypothetical protein